MRALPVLILALSVLGGTTAGAGPWKVPGQVLGLPWGTPLEAAREKFPGGQLRRDTRSTATYATATHIDGIPLSASFQFVSEQGLQGVILRFPVHRLLEMVAVFERQYGLAPIRGNQQWRWEGDGVRISLGEYPSLTTVGRKGIAWLRTGALEAAIAPGGAAGRASGGHAAAPGGASGGGGSASQVGYEDRLLRRIYWQLRYPETTQGVYLVSLAFQLTPTGHAMALELEVDPPNPEVAESVRAAVSRAQPFPLPPAAEQDPRVTLALTVTIMP